MFKKLLEKSKLLFESFFVGEKTFNAEYMVASTLQIVLVISFIVLAEYSKRHIGEHVSGSDLRTISFAMEIFIKYMYLLLIIIFIQSTMLLYRKSRSVFFTLLYDMYYLLFIAIGGAIIFLLKT